MHPNHDGLDIRRCFVTIYYRVKPPELVVVELLQTRIVERYEIDVAIGPMIITAQLVILRIIVEPLRLDDWILQPVGELKEPGVARGGRNGFMIPDCEKYRDAAERVQLMSDEVRPSRGQISDDVDGSRLKSELGRRNHVFIEHVDGAKVTQVPVKI